MSLKCVLLSFTEGCHRSYLHSHTLATRNSAVNPPSPSIEAVLLLEAPAGRPSLTLFLPSWLESSDKASLSFHLHLLFFCHFHFSHKHTDFKNRSGLWKRAGPYKMTFQFPRSITQWLSVMFFCCFFLHWWNKHVFRRRWFGVQELLYIICCINIAIFCNLLLVLNMHAISQPN